MNFADLHEMLRLELVRRIDAGALTGTRLAQQTGFRQAHISNFLNRKRALSLEGLDRVLQAQRLTVDQILPVALDAKSSSVPQEEPFESVPLVSPSVAMEHSRIAPAAILETLPLSAARLHESHPRLTPARIAWQRFVAIRIDAQQSAAMAPALSTGAIAILDRHSLSLAPSRSAEPALFAIRSGSALLLRFVELDDDRLILRPSSPTIPVQLIPLAPGQAPSDLLIGRITLVLSTL